MYINLILSKGLVDVIIFEEFVELGINFIRKF